MKSFYSLLLILLCLPAAAQKHTTHVIEGGDLEKIILSSDEIYIIKISTHPGSEIKIGTDAEGEYYNDINLDVERQANTLFLNSRFREILQSGFDKLSAHKVFSMEVELEIPVGMKIEINSNVASVYLKGKYNHALVQLKNGSCYLEKFEGNALINTLEGNILGDAKNFEAEANSRHGKVLLPVVTQGNHKMVLTSINGDIKLSETK